MFTMTPPPPSFSPPAFHHTSLPPVLLAIEPEIRSSVHHHHHAFPSRHVLPAWPRLPLRNARRHGAESAVPEVRAALAQERRAPRSPYRTPARSEVPGGQCVEGKRERGQSAGVVAAPAPSVFRTACPTIGAYRECLPPCYQDKRRDDEGEGEQEKREQHSRRRRLSSAAAVAARFVAYRRQSARLRGSAAAPRTRRRRQAHASGARGSSNKRAQAANQYCRNPFRMAVKVVEAWQRTSITIQAGVAGAV